MEIMQEEIEVVVEDTVDGNNNVQYCYHILL